MGTLNVVVTVNNSVYNLKLFVIKGTGTNLLGRDWINVIQLDLNKVINTSTIKQMKTNDVKMVPDNLSPDIQKRLNKILEKHSALFEDRIGRMKGYKAKIYLKADATPKFAKARTVPFALEDSINAELDRLEQEGILKSVPFSEWASPIVVVPKPDGSVRICGDYKRTSIRTSKRRLIQLPATMKFFRKFKGVKHFPKLTYDKHTFN